MSIHVHTLGDSTLDNYYWLLNGKGDNLKEAKEGCVEGQLQEKLGQQYRVISHAYDGFTTHSLLNPNGDQIGAVLPGMGAKFDAYMRHKIGDGSSASVTAKPLEDLEDCIKKYPQKIHYAVISVGGNDFRVNLADPIKLLTDVPKVQERYLQIVDRVRNLGPTVRPILMFQYRTDARSGHDPYKIYTILGLAGGIIAAIHSVCIAVLAASAIAMKTGRISTISSLLTMAIAGSVLAASTMIAPLRVTKDILTMKSPGMVMLCALMEKFYRPILEYAKRNSLPILDLPNSIDPYENNYISGIEPSARGASQIATGLKYMIDIINSEGNTDFRLYKTQGENSKISPMDWRVGYRP